LRPGVLAVNLSPQRRTKSTAKAQRRKGKTKTIFFCFYFKISCSSLRLGVLAVNLSLALLCVLASWRLIFHRKGAKSTAKAQRKDKNYFFFTLKSLAPLCALASLRLIFLLLFFAPWRLGGESLEIVPFTVIFNLIFALLTLVENGDPRFP